MHALSTGKLSSDVIWEPNESYNHCADRGKGNASPSPMDASDLQSLTLTNGESFISLPAVLYPKGSMWLILPQNGWSGSGLFGIKIVPEGLFRWWLGGSVNKTVYVRFLVLIFLLCGGWFPLPYRIRTHVALLIVSASIQGHIKPMCYQAKKFIFLSNHIWKTKKT